MSEIGHNSEAFGESPDVINQDAQGRLRSFVARLETLDDQKDDILSDAKEVYAELKGEGFDPKAIRKLISLRKKDRAKVIEAKTILELYASALGCLDLV